MQIGGVFIRIYNDMPTFPIQHPKQFAWDLLEYLKQAYHYMMCMKNSSQTIPYTGEAVSPTLSGAGDGILKPTLAPNHPQLKLQHHQTPVKSGTTFDEVLNAYNRSKSRKKLETEALLEQQKIQSQYKYDFAKDSNVEQHIIMVLKALISVIKANHDVEIQCIGNFDMIFGFLANNLFSDVRLLGRTTYLSSLLFLLYFLFSLYRIPQLKLLLWRL